MTPDPLEKKIETQMRKVAVDLGFAPYKFTSPSRRSVPDRLVLAPVPEWIREIVGQYVVFIEFKRKGRKATAAQQREHDYLRTLGYRVEIVDSVEQGKVILGSMG